MTVLAVATVLLAWCLAGTVFGLVLCQAIRWADAVDLAPDPAPAATRPTAAAPVVQASTLPAPRGTDEQLEVSAAEGSGKQLVEP